MKQWISLFILGLAFSFTASAEQLKVHEYQLKNGLKLLVKEDHRAPVAITQVWYKVGSSYEPNGITGISHVLEHMMFRGSKDYSAEKFLQTVAENGGQQNAFTYYDYTGYYELMGADKLAVAFKLEADRMRNLTLSEKDFAKEIQVVMEERRMRTEDNPQMLTNERFQAAAFIASPYHHTPIGWMNDLQNLKIEDVRKWYETWYAPNNAIVVVVGDVKPDQVYQLAEKYFGPLKPSVLPVLKPQNDVASVGTRIVRVAVPAKVPFILMGYNTPVVNTAQQKWEPYALSVLQGILDGGDSARLEKDLVRGKQIASGIDIDYDPHFRLNYLFTIGAVPASNHNVEEIKTAILDEIKQLQNQLVTPEELERVKAQVIAAKVYEDDSIANQASAIGSLEAVGLSWREDQNTIDQIKAVTADQVQAVARKYLRPENLTIAILQPLAMPAEKKSAPPVQSGEKYVH